MRIKLTKQIILFAIAITFTNIVIAQKAPIKFGKVTLEELEMTNCDIDTSAVAVVLCDYGVFNRENIEFTRTCRIKILKKEGVRYANVYVRNRGTLALKARTYNLVDGNIEITKMKGESIYEEKFKKQKFATRFTLPNVKVGSVIEFTYTFFGIPSQWRFQNTIPVKWSELRMPENTSEVSIQRIFTGFEYIKAEDDIRWYAKDLPAFKNEPYMSSQSNFITKFDIEIRKFNLRWYSGMFTTSWEQVSKTLLDDYYFGDKIRNDLYLTKDANRIKKLNVSDLKKAQIAFEFIRNEIAWNEYEHVFAYGDLHSVFKDKVGSSAEINLMLISLLKKIGLNVHPVALSTRENGILSPFFPSLAKLNYVIAHLEIGDEIFLLDATEKNLPFGVLPKRCLNGEGRFIDKKVSKWVKLDSKASSKEVSYYTLKLHETGEIEGTISNNLFDFAAFDFRNKLEEYTSSDDYISEKESQYAGLNILKYNFENMDSISKPISAKYEISFMNDANVMPGKIYLNPFFLNKVNDNPFKTPDREFPVDFIHPISKTYVLNLTIPDGYEINSLPEATRVNLPGNKGSFYCTAKANNQLINLTYKFEIKDPVILPNEYQYLQQFYELLVAKHSEMIALTKIEE